MDIEKLLDRSRQGDRKSSLLLIKRFKPLVLASIKRYHSSGDFEDLISQGNIIILECIKDFDLDYGVAFQGFLKSKLKYHYLNLRWEQDLSLNVADENGLEYIDRLKSTFDVEEKVDSNISSSRLRSYLKGLSARERQVLEKYYFKDLTMAEVASSLGISYRTVANTKYRAIKKLKSLVKNPL